MYIQQCGTEKQRIDLLPEMASGRHIYAHTYHEQGIKNPHNFATTVSPAQQGWLLHGKKNWVTNAHHADRMIVIARNTSQVSAIIVDPNNKASRSAQNSIDQT